MVRRQRRPPARPRRPIAGHHARRVLRAVPGTPRRHRQRAHARDARGAARARASRVRRLDARRARRRRRRHRALARAAARHVALPAHAGAAADARRGRALALLGKEPGRRRRTQSGAAQRGAAAVHARRGRRARGRAGAGVRPARRVRAETGLRTNEWAATERRDVDRTGPAVVVQRRYADGVLTPYPKTARRRVPLTGRAWVRSTSCRRGSTRRCCSPRPRAGTSASTRGARASGIRRSTRPGIRRRGPYQLRHTSRPRRSLPGSRSSSWPRDGRVGEDDRQHYGHLARDSEQAIRARLDARAERSGDVVASDPDA